MIHVSLIDALRGRRSRRFGAGMKMPAGPLAYTSRFPAAPLTEAEEGALVFAACGITGPALADLCFAPGGGGAIMAGLTGRTIASGDGIQTVSLFVTNDAGTWFVKRPQQMQPAEISDLIEMSRADSFAEIYRKMRVQTSTKRAVVPSEPLFNISANQWSAHAKGTTYFLPVNDLSLMYINGLLEILNEDTGAFILDERANFRPAGLGKFAKSKGGHLHDKIADGRGVTIQVVERFVAEFCTVEQGMMLQNLGLMAQALGLGGFPNFANHEFAWFDALGFAGPTMRASEYLGVNPLVRWGMRLSGQDIQVHFPTAFSPNGNVGAPLLSAFCPPNHASMREAVMAVVDLKYGANGVLRRKGGDCSWVDGDGVKKQIPGPSEKAIEATIAYCEYVWERYGRFPCHMPPFRTVLGFQACHLDLEFYDRFYKAEAVSETQRDDFARNVKPKAGS
jgi:hypothetical protein